MYINNEKNQHQASDCNINNNKTVAHAKYNTRKNETKAVPCQRPLFHAFIHHLVPRQHLLILEINRVHRALGRHHSLPPPPVNHNRPCEQPERRHDRATRSPKYQRREDLQEVVAFRLRLRRIGLAVVIRREFTGIQRFRVHSVERVFQAEAP
ncbi:hypothetical protein QJS10_CPA07g00073 [Acorus calamus]|uniref:Uncharacterized protein n=1 Tax=Acorus calamus TaxID=4465 RepID=A0AAV9EF72_ACOCL|nr:hypothetical protein QJS10_CPA07g00073 [Acorus calamus]